MLQNYLKIMLRSIWRTKLYASLNILGFALGMACCIAIMLWVQYQWSFNRFNANIDRTYRLLRTEQLTNEIVTLSALPGPLGEALKAEVPEIEHLAHVLSSENVLSVGTNSFREEGVQTNSDVFSVFSFPLLAGEPSAALQEPNSLVISASLAKKLFGSTNVVGATVRLDNKDDYKVTAVFKDIPKNSSVRFEYATSVQAYIAKNEWAQKWDNNSFRTFITLRQSATQQAVDAKLRDFIRKKRNDPKAAILFTQALGDAYLYGKFENGVQQGGRIEIVRLFVVIAGLVLMIACINFMNLSTARGVRRSKEVGVRKAVGATRMTIMQQILGESVFTALLALPIALVVVEAVLPALNEMTGAQIVLPVTNPFFWCILLCFAVVTGCFAGIYPALLLSSFSIVSVLKGIAKSGPLAMILRRGLVIAEFTIAIAFIVATMVIYRQIEYIKTKNIGLNRENVVSLSVDISPEKYAVWKQELKSLPGILGVGATSDNTPIEIGSNTYGMHWKGQQPNETIAVSFLFADEDFMQAMGIQLKEGRSFSSQFIADSTNYIINETCARQMRLQNPIGETLRWGDRSGTVIGVMKDFHFSSMHSAIDPLMLVKLRRPDFIYVRIAPGKTAEVMERLRHSAATHQRGLPFTYKFLDKEFDALYKSEMMIGQLALYFAVIAVCICCLGLLGLAMFTTEQRTKEIGIRKVLGASVASIVSLLSKDFLALVAIAIILATPLAYWAMSKWLQDFAYRVELQWWVFAAAGVVAVGIAFLTVAGQAWRAARANPVNALRSE
jgi:predicted permease